MGFTQGYKLPGRSIGCGRRFLGGMEMKRMLALLLAVLLLPLQAGAVEISGKSGVLMEAATGTVLYEQAPREALAPASVTKIMTLLLIMEAVDDGRIMLTDTVTASETAAAKGGSQIYLKAGETMRVEDMVKSIAVSSANDCACAMAEHLAGSESAFVEKMNEKARQLGMENTHFVNCTGLDDGPEAKDHRTSAYDIALMSRELLTKHPGVKKYTTIWMDTVRGGTFGLSNTNKLVRFYPGATGLKTGFTTGAGYCLSATAQRDGMELIAVVMGSETSQKRNESCKQLLDYGFANYGLHTPELPEVPVIPVKLGKAETVTLELAENQPLLVEKARKGALETEMTVEDTVTAPVEKGQRLGTLTVRDADRILAEIPLTAAQEVPRLTLWDLFVKVLRRIAMAG